LRRENIFPNSQIGRTDAAKRLRFAAKERKFVTGRVTNFVVLTGGVRGARKADAVSRRGKTPACAIKGKNKLCKKQENPVT
jgi:hypothetical protein